MPASAHSDPSVVELLLWAAGAWPPTPFTAPDAASAQAFGLLLDEAHTIHSVLGCRWSRCWLGPSPARQEQLIAALQPWLQQPRWFAPWGRPLLLLTPLENPTAQGFWLQPHAAGPFRSHLFGS